jgi:hypothetical protein
MRHYYYVVKANGSTWDVRSSQEPTHSFSSKEAAIEAARQACRQREERLRRPCGVRIQHGMSDWVDDLANQHEEATH